MFISFTKRIIIHFEYIRIVNRHLPWKSSKEGLSVNWEFHIALIQSWGSFCNSKRRKTSTVFANNLSGWNINNMYYRFSCSLSNAVLNAHCLIRCNSFLPDWSSISSLFVAVAYPLLFPSLFDLNHKIVVILWIYQPSSLI